MYLYREAVDSSYISPFVVQEFIKIASTEKLGIMHRHEDEIRRGGIWVGAERK